MKLFFKEVCLKEMKDKEQRQMVVGRPFVPILGQCREEILRFKDGNGTVKTWNRLSVCQQVTTRWGLQELRTHQLVTTVVSRNTGIEANQSSIRTGSLRKLANRVTDNPVLCTQNTGFCKMFNSEMFRQVYITKTSVKTGEFQQLSQYIICQIQEAYGTIQH